MSHDSLAEYKVHKIQELKRQNRREEARDLLERISKQVQPILRKRQWTVPSLKEFLPKNPNLLGLNVNGRRGTTTEIRIRLRYQHSPDSFYPYEDVLGTMLHEITHNVQSPHDAKFYAILDELTKECEDLMAKGVAGTGVGFDGPSSGRLGGYSWIPQHNSDPAAMKAAQLKAAQKRAAQQAIMSQGPRRLGGSVVKSMTPREAAAAAAERRARDNLWCPSAAIAAGEKIVIDLIDDSDDDIDPTNSTHPSNRVVAVRLPTTYSAAAAATTRQQGHQSASQQTLRKGHVGRNIEVPATAPRTGVQQAEPTLSRQRQMGRPASAAYSSKAGEAAATRAEATRHSRDAIGSAPRCPTVAAARSRHPQPTGLAERLPRSPPCSHNLTAPLSNHDRGKHVGTAGQAGTGCSSGAAVRALGELDDLGSDDDDIQIVGVCACGSGTAAATQPLQQAAEASYPQSPKHRKRSSQCAGGASVPTSAGSPSLARGFEWEKQAQKSQRRDANNGATAAHASACPGNHMPTGRVTAGDRVKLEHTARVLSDRNGRDTMAQQQNPYDRRPCHPEEKRDSLIDLT